MHEDASYTIRLEDRGEYLYALVGGEKLSPVIARMYWDEIAAKCAELGKSKILIEKDFPSHVSVPEMLEMGVYLGSILAGTKIAFIDRYKNEDVNELGKVIARNEGVIMKVFSKTEDAKEWLIQN
ncbi:hypothetical protein BH20ACI4_BH20ACI4_11870 [soil metagenome]